MATENPRVSLFLICYNHEKFLQTSLDSIFRQTYPNIELIIVDDFSSDNSVKIIEDWISNRKVECRFIKHTSNQGLVKTLNECLSNSSGEFVSFFAADDVITDDKTEILVRYLDKLPCDVGVAYGDLSVIDKFGNVTQNSFYNWNLQEVIPAASFIFESFISHNAVHILGGLVRREVYNKVGHYDETLVYEDWDMNMRIARNYKFFCLPRVVGSYRKFKGQMTDVYWTDKKKYSRVLGSDFTMFSKHLDLIEYRGKLARKLFDILIEQERNRFLSWPKKVITSLFVLRHEPKNYNLWFFFIGSILNQSMLIYTLFRKSLQAIKRFS